MTGKESQLNDQAARPQPDAVEEGTAVEIRPKVGGIAGFDRLAPADGAFYIYADVGRLTKIGPFGFRTELAAGLLVSPGNILIGQDNAVYVTVNTKTAGTGQVLRIAR